MINITYIDHEGNEKQVAANDGESLMETAVSNDVPGILADCGGACACATCHVFIDPLFVDKMPAMDESEQAMLEFTDGVQGNSRLACQIIITDAMEGLRVVTPESQV
ncbi:MAG: 2Fe-2S iron-sulfur cluster binding domain-containing protein [Cellvibrionaceae bacterium]|nr:2Fe-2S iron-sulfur cluster binding domain-containing protein [Cellvibrionaceae bacterium]